MRAVLGWKCRTQTGQARCCTGSMAISVAPPRLFFEHPVSGRLPQLAYTAPSRDQIVGAGLAGGCCLYGRGPHTASAAMTPPAASFSDQRGLAALRQPCFKTDSFGADWFRPRLVRQAGVADQGLWGWAGGRGNARNLLGLRLPAQGLSTVSRKRRPVADDLRPRSSRPTSSKALNASALSTFGPFVE